MHEESVGYQLKRVQHVLRIQMDNALREIGLTTPQYAALNAIEEKPGLSGNKIARQCFVTPQTMNLILTNLESVGLIIRRPHPGSLKISSVVAEGPLFESREGATKTEKCSASQADGAAIRDRPPRVL